MIIHDNTLIKENLDILDRNVLLFPFEKPIEKKSHRPCVLLSIALFILALGVTFLIYYLFIQPIPPKELKDRSLFLNHYSIINQTVSTTTYEKSFLLQRDSSPDFEGDIIQPSTDNQEINQLAISIITESDHRLHVTIRDAEKERWEIPFKLQDEVSEYDSMLSEHRSSIIDTNIKLSHSRYSFSLSDLDGKTPIASTNGTYFRYMEKYISFEILIPSQRLMGLGERMGNISLREGTYTLFPKDQYPSFETRKNPGRNLHGMHPFLLYQIEKGEFAGFYLKNSNAMQAEIKMQNKKSSVVRFTMVGGIIDFYLFYKGRAQFILQQYHKIIGKPYLPPLWALGYHHGKTGFKNIGELKTLLNKFTSFNIPLDGLWVDTDILENHENFNIDNNRFVNLSLFVETDLHSRNIHFVPTTKAGFNMNKNYRYYVKGRTTNSFVKSNITGNDVVGKDYSGMIAYPNFFSRKMTNLWAEGILSFLYLAKYDGLFLTLNEFSSLCNGDCNDPHSNHSYDNIPFTPGGVSLNSSTLSMSSMYPSNNPMLNKFLYEFNVHSLNSFLMIKNTHDSLSPDNKRQFVVSSSGFPGIQKYSVGHLVKGTISTWDHLRYSIPEVLNSQMFGISLPGSSICGYKGDALEDLCQTWMQLGMFYPLSLNFNSQNSSPQEPYHFGLSARQSMINAIRFKYSLLRYIYTCIFEMSLVGGAAVQPLFFEFPEDDMAFRTSERVLLYGKGLLITTALQAGSEYTVYLPKENWYQIPSGEKVASYNAKAKEGTTLHVDTSTDLPHVFLRGGMIIPYQDAISSKITNVGGLESVPMTLIIAVDHEGKAKGRMVVDDGISKDTIQNKDYRHYKFIYTNKLLKVSLLEGYNSSVLENYPFEYVSKIEIWGAANAGKIKTAMIMSFNMSCFELSISYDEELQKLILVHETVNQILWKDVEAVLLYEGNDYNICFPQLIARNVKLASTFQKMSAIIENEFGFEKTAYKVDADLLNTYILNLKISPTTWDAWEIPAEKGYETFKKSEKLSFGDYLFAISQSPSPFYFVVSDPSDIDKTILTTESQPFIFTEHFIKFGMNLSAIQLYGLGERNTENFALVPGRYTITANGRENQMDNGKIPGKSLYGSHPFLLFRMQDQNYGGLFLKTSNAMDVDISKCDESSYKLTFIISGGIFDFYFIQKGPVNLVLENYHSLIGKPFLPPYWAFGNHQSRTGYRTQDKLGEVVEGFLNANISLDGIWLDMDYMDSNVPFTRDINRFPEMFLFVKYLKSQNIKILPVIHPGISINKTNKAYNEGRLQDIFIRGENGNVVGKGWGGYCTYVDFFHPKSHEYWYKMLKYFQRSIFNFDGLSLDMNEITNFCDGECLLNDWQSGPLTESNPSFDNLVYVPGHTNLERGKLPLNSRYYTSKEIGRENFMEFNIHSLYSHLQIEATNEFFAKAHQRGLIISRSTFPGSGHFAGHALGNNKSLWPYLRYSITEIFNFQIFGVPFVGADVCGYYGNITIELCQRWYQLAAFYPLCRNHNSAASIDQEPYIHPKLAKTAQAALNLRYSLLRYLYTCHFNVAKDGGVYFYPIFFDFPRDSKYYENTEISFMLGPALKVTPVLAPNVKTIPSYFPNQNWFALLTGHKDVIFKKGVIEGETLVLDADVDKDIINVHIRGGSIIPFQDTFNETIRNTRELTRAKTKLIIAPDSYDRAKGFIAFDEGEGSETLMHKAYHLFNLTYIDGELRIDLLLSSRYIRSPEFRDEFIESVIFYGAAAYKDVTYGCVCFKKAKANKLLAQYDDKNEKLSFNFDKSVSLLDIRAVIWKNTNPECAIACE